MAVDRQDKTSLCMLVPCLCESVFMHACAMFVCVCVSSSLMGKSDHIPGQHHLRMAGFKSSQVKCVCKCVCMCVCGCTYVSCGGP